MKQKILFVIPARGGSKGIPHKNIKPLGGKPLIHYTLEFARLFTTDENICLTTDCNRIAECAKEIKYFVPFFRPAHLATDEAGTYEVLQHALAYYENRNFFYNTIVLLQPTSPFRTQKHLIEMLKSFSTDDEMLVSVCESKSNPYYNLFEENSDGYLKISKENVNVNRRQDVPPVYEYNGSIYIISSNSLKTHKGFRDFKKVKKYVMPEIYGVDLDSIVDWGFAQYILKTKQIK
ncbi:MAG: acylneuraminate cytidylyltransferase family protein [Rhodothermia bacterium]|nr:acylneuraminate cytidylyltransferase family protein [Rhodothermia bacterium]